MDRYYNREEILYAFSKYIELNNREGCSTEIRIAERIEKLDTEEIVGFEDLCEWANPDMYTSDNLNYVLDRIDDYYYNQIHDIEKKRKQIDKLRL